MSLNKQVGYWLAGALAFFSGCADEEAQQSAAMAANEDASKMVDASYESTHIAIEEAIRVCMADQGFDYQPVQFIALEDLEPDPYGVKLLFYLSSDDVTNHGYFVVQTVLESAIDFAQDMENSPQGDEGVYYWDTLLGTEEALGCVETAPRTVDGAVDAGQMFEVLVETESQLRERLLADPEYQALSGMWGECMATSGVPPEGDIIEFRQSFFDEAASEVDQSLAGEFGQLEDEEAWVAYNKWILDMGYEQLFELPSIRSHRAHELEIAAIDLGCLAPVLPQLDALATRHAKELYEG